MASLLTKRNKQTTAKPMKMVDDIGARVKEITAKSLDIDPSLVGDLSDFSLDLGADSLDSVELIMTFEDSFDIEISDLEIDDIHTVAEVTAYIMEKIHGTTR